MKTWISYLAATALGLAATLLFGDSQIFGKLVYSITAFLIQIGGFILIPVVFFGFSSGIASLRKDSKGKTFAGNTILWSILSTLLAVIGGILVFRLLPSVFPASSTAGADPAPIQNMVGKSLSTLFEGLLPSNPFYSLASAESFLLPVLIVAFIFGYFLKPNVEVIRPAYVTMNSLSEAMFRMARAYSTIGHFFIFFASAYFFTRLQNEGTIFVSARFLLLLLVASAALLLVLMPLLYGILTRFKANPYQILYRMLAPALAGLFSGSIFFSSPMTIALSRQNLGCQKRVSATSVPLFTLLGRGGSAMVGTISICALLQASMQQIPPISVILAVAGACAFVSYASALYLGYEVFFITVMATKMLNIDLYGAQMTLIALMPLLNGIGTLIDSYVAAFGASIICQKMGIRSDPAYRDIV